jgi:hypothetical protein
MGDITTSNVIKYIEKRSTKYSYKLVDGNIVYTFRIGHSNLNISVSQESSGLNNFDIDITNIYVQTYLNEEDRDRGINVLESYNISLNGENILYNLRIIDDLIDRLNIAIHRDAYTREFKVYTNNEYMHLFDRLSEDKFDDMQLTFVDLRDLKIKPLTEEHIRKLNSKCRIYVTIEYKEDVDCHEKLIK